jgi:hypothetical protein
VDKFVVFRATCDVLLDRNRMKVYIWYQFSIKYLLLPSLFIGETFAGSVRLKSCTKFPKLHNVTGEGSSFVRKYVINLTELFIQVATLNFCWHVILCAIDAYVALNNFCLVKSHYL